MENKVQTIQILGHCVKYEILERYDDIIILKAMIETAIKEGDVYHDIRISNPCGGLSLDMKIGRWWIENPWKELCNDMYLKLLKNNVPDIRDKYTLNERYKKLKENDKG